MCLLNSSCAIGEINLYDNSNAHRKIHKFIKHKEYHTFEWKRCLLSCDCKIYQGIYTADVQGLCFLVRGLKENGEREQG